VSERDLSPFIQHEPHEVHGENPGDLELFDVTEVEGIDTSSSRNAIKAVNKHLENNPDIMEHAKAQKQDVLLRISKRTWIITGLSIAGVAAGIGAKVLYNHLKEKKREENED
jgi:hypothetical protein